MRLIPKLLFKLFGFAINKCDRTESSIAMLRFTHKCPNRCSFCIDRKTPNFNEIPGACLASIALDTNKDIIAITGGEPFVNVARLINFVERVYGKKKMYINTSLPLIAWKNRKDTLDIFSMMDNIDISMHGFSQKDDEMIFGRGFRYDKFRFIRQIAKRYSDKLYVSCVLDKRFFKNLDDIRRRIKILKRLGVKKFYFNELANLSGVDANYIAFNEILKNSRQKLLKDPYPFGCHNDISYLFDDLGVEVHLKRQCFKHGGVEKMSLMSKIKELVKMIFVRNAMKDELYIYENASTSNIRKCKYF